MASIETLAAKWNAFDRSEVVEQLAKFRKSDVVRFAGLVGMEYLRNDSKKTILTVLRQLNERIEVSTVQCQHYNRDC